MIVIAVQFLWPLLVHRDFGMEFLGFNKCQISKKKKNFFSNSPTFPVIFQNQFLGFDRFQISKSILDNNLGSLNLFFTISVLFFVMDY
ncbi:unnamed protein product [Coffea canephora]|uniref:Uncharacterized protein n=1 Tax=Coffea canephora TaxID=49390 RepID=A0A068V0S4_COFCA|nr:unnamed protein product [Coffea canephora]